MGIVVMETVVVLDWQEAHASMGVASAARLRKIVVIFCRAILSVVIRVNVVMVCVVQIGKCVVMENVYY